LSEVLFILGICCEAEDSIFGFDKEDLLLLSDKHTEVGEHNKFVVGDWKIFEEIKSWGQIAE